MKELKPKIAAQLANEVYFVQNKFTLEEFMKRPEFSKGQNSQAYLTAEVGTRLINTRDGFGLCAIGGQNYKRQMFVIFRGSTNANLYADWVSNFRIGLTASKTGLPVHLGFNNIFTSMLPEISKFYEAHKNHVDSIHCIGHSLGGAVAVLAADWLKSKSGKDVKVYTFGAPKPSTRFFSQEFTKKLGKDNIFRAYHPTDPVPMIPLFPYLHPPLPGFGHYIFTQENSISAAAHDRRLYVKSVGEMSWSAFERFKPPYTIETKIERWLQSTMPVSESSPKIWEWINSALIYVLKKIFGAALHGLQAVLIDALTLADTIAYILRKSLVDPILKPMSNWVLLLMKKIMQVLGRKVPEKEEELTHDLMRHALTRIMEKTTEEAKKAIQNI